VRFVPVVFERDSKLRPGQIESINDVAVQIEHAMLHGRQRESGLHDEQPQRTLRRRLGAPVDQSQQLGSPPGSATITAPP
jgi:hypothetical protein